MEYLHIFFGVIMLIIGAEGLVRGGTQFALALRIPVMVVALVLVGFGTSAPEITVCLIAAFKSSTEMALGNILGSSIANTALVLGIAALINPVIIKKTLLKKEIPIVILLHVILLVFILNSNISRIEGFIFVFAGVFYNYYLIQYTRKERNNTPEPSENDENPKLKYPWWMSLTIAIVGLVVIISGSDQLIIGASSLAKKYGMSDRLIGLTIVAIGTSLPEIATSIVASIRKQSDIIIGNIIGSNIFNLAIALGFTALIYPVKVQNTQVAMTWFDALTATVLSVVLWLFLKKDKSLSRFEGCILFTSYFAYLLIIAFI